MAEECLDAVVILCQLCFGEQGMNLLMADTVQDLGLLPPVRTGNQMMGITLGLGYWPRAQRANNRPKLRQGIQPRGDEATPDLPGHHCSLTKDRRQASRLDCASVFTTG